MIESTYSTLRRLGISVDAAGGRVCVLFESDGVDLDPAVADLLAHLLETRADQARGQSDEACNALRRTLGGE